jgi:hypothetical protein
MLAYGFTENCQFGEKTDRNSVFLNRDPHIVDQLYITVSYMSFMSFEKNQIFAQNSLVLAYSFTENHQLGAKIDRNSVFLCRDPHITDRLYITVSYMSFYGFKKNPTFGHDPV